MFIDKESYRRSKSIRYSTDELALKIHNAMLKDFQSVLPHFRERNKTPLSGIESFRDPENSIDYSSTSVYRFKAHAQMENLLKKYRFKNDVYSDVELDDRSIGDFLAFQEEISSVFKGDSPIVHRVLRRARKIARSILGKYEESEMLTYCRFGTNSSIGCPLSLAHIDYKLSTVKAFTGSSCIAKWFKKNVFDEDVIFRGVLRGITKDKNFWNTRHLQTESLKLATVPKTWKVNRVITPLPLLDLFYSNGYGSLVAERLSNIGLNISRLQQRHRRLVKKFSLTRSHVTADLSKASDCITSWLLNCILPRDWFTALKPILYNQLTWNDTRYYTSSVLPMGNGATFPVETLIFYCVLKAISELGDIRGLISVYGDDLIYPSQMHKYVKVVLPMLGFKLNLDKTFNRAFFRESCGSDFYRGTDVRPFYFKGQHRLLSKTQMVAELYKTVNGLRLRWEWSELLNTFRYLLSEIVMLTDDVYRVPPSYPVTSGVQVRTPNELPTEFCGLSYVERILPVQQVKAEFAYGTRCFSFGYLSETADKRYVLSAEPYYWLLLDGKDDVKLSYNDILSQQPRGSLVKKLIEQLINSKRSQLTWKSFKVPIYRKYRNKKNELVTKAEFRKKWRALVSEKQLTHYQSAQGLVTDWI